MKQLKLIVHYHREDRNYKDWNLWIWSEQNCGTIHYFDNEDDFGKVALVYADIKTENMGIIVRTDRWEKDVSIDRYVDVSGDLAEIWIISGEESIMMTPEDGKIPFNINFSGNASIRVHYRRYDQYYLGWNMWLWPEGEPGNCYHFNAEDEFGVIAHIVVPNTNESTSIGCIIKKGGWEEKDLSKNRFINLTKINDKAISDVYIVQGDDEIYYNIDDVDLSPKFLQCELDGLSSVFFEVSTSYALDEKDKLFQVVDEDYNDVKISYVECWNHAMTRYGKLYLEKLVTLGKKYIIRSPRFGEMTIGITDTYNINEFNEVFYYDGNDLGATYYGKEKTSFRIWAPTADNVQLKLYEQGAGGQLMETIQMIKDIKGTWVVEINRDLNGVYYTYDVRINGINTEAVDPYAKAVGVNGDRGLVVDFTQTNPEGWEQDKAAELKHFTDAIVYELHVRDLSISQDANIKHSGKFLGLTEKGTKNDEGYATGLDHILELGVTHVQLLPIFDYLTIDETMLHEPDFNWGYDPENYNAVDGSYSTNPYDGATRIKEFKKMIKTLHDNGLRMVMDVVYNHTGESESSDLNTIVPNYYYRTYEGKFSNGSGCGNETASERVMVRKMIVDSVTHWAKEYHINGFRFDLMGLHDLDTMRAIRNALDEIDPSIIIYGEGWIGGLSTLPIHERSLKQSIGNLKGIGTFSDDIRDAIKGDTFFADHPGFVNGDANMRESVMFGIVGGTYHHQINYGYVKGSNSHWANAPAQSVNYVAAHDNYTLWDKICKTNPYDTKEVRERMDKLAAAIFITSQGVPFLHAGMEFLRSKDGEHNSYNAPDDINQLEWVLKTENIHVFNYYKGLIALRKAHPAFRMSTTDEIRNNLVFFNKYNQLYEPHYHTIAYMITNHANGDEAGTLLVFFNGNRVSVEYTIPEGEWDVLVHDNQAGVMSMDKIINCKVTVEPLSATILSSNEIIVL